MHGARPRRVALGRSDIASLARCWAGFSSLGAGLVHLAVVQEHLAEWWVYGVFFVAAGAAQAVWSLLAMARESVPSVRLVVAGNLGLVGLWAVTRTVGLPFGPEPWTPEAVGTADVLGGVLELLVVGALALWAATRRTTSGAERPGLFLAVLFAGALAISAVTTPALAATPAGGSAHPHGEHGH